MDGFEQTTLANINIVRGLANSLGGGFNKGLGQNFLINQNSLLKFINSIHLNNQDLVIEIGPGIGVVTYSLCQTAKKVYLIEIDRNKEEALKKVLENFTNYEIIWADASEIDYAELYKKILTDFPETKVENIKLIGSLPYNISKKIIYRIFTTNIEWSEASFFLQREVADNYASNVPNGEFLAAHAQIFSDVSFAFGIPPEHFIPKPKVKTGVIHFKKHNRFAHLDRIKFSSFIKHGYDQPRKTILNNLKAVGITKDLISTTGIKETARPSEVTISQWEKLYLLTGKK